MEKFRGERAQQEWQGRLQEDGSEATEVDLEGDPGWQVRVRPAAQVLRPTAAEKLLHGEALSARAGGYKPRGTRLLPDTADQALEPRLRGGA